MTLSELDAAERHRQVAARFADLVRGVDDWTVPTPVREWVARDVVDHLVTWLPAFVAAGSRHTLPSGPRVVDDPLGAWTTQVEAIQALVDDPEVAAAPFRHTHVPEMPFGQAIDRIYTADVFQHTWDLARATGQNDTLDPGFAEELLVGIQPMEDVLRGSGQFGPAWPVAADAPIQDRLIAFIGRDPHWLPSETVRS